MNIIHRFLVISVLCLCFLGFNTGVYVNSQSTDTTQISITVSSLCQASLIAYPEKRIPSTGNWSNLNEIEIYNSVNQKVGSLTLTSDNLGKMPVDLCQDVQLSPGSYTFYIKGFSHLRRKIQNIQIQALNSVVPIDILLTTPDKLLLAGETSPVFDNKINSLDISTQIKAMYSTTSVKNDLNRDGKVNTLDISNTIYNFYKLGE